MNMIMVLKVTFSLVIFLLTLTNILENTEEAIKKGHSRDTGNIDTKHRTKTNKTKNRTEEPKKKTVQDRPHQKLGVNSDAR